MASRGVGCSSVSLGVEPFVYSSSPVFGGRPLPGVSGGSPRVSLFSGYQPVSLQAGSPVRFGSFAAAADQPVRLPERAAGGLVRVPWSKSVGGPGPP